MNLGFELALNWQILIELMNKLIEILLLMILLPLFSLL